MTGKERVLEILNHKKTDRPAWVPFAGVHAGNLIGKNATEVLTNADDLYNALEKVYELYQPDGMPVIFDLQVEAESVKSHPLQGTTNILCGCKQPTPDKGRIPMIVDVMKRVKRGIGESTALYGLICGPFTLASHLRGNDIFMDMVLNEEYVKSLMAYTTETALKMADIYIDAGMDVIAVVDPLVSQISPDHFVSMCHDAFSTVFEYIRAKGVKSSFFVCGNATRQIEVMCKTNPDSISIDENVDIKLAKEITDKYHITIGGNIPLTTLMLHGTQQENMKYVVDMLDNMSTDNLIVAPGCDMPYAVPAENTIGIGQAVRELDTVRQIVADYVAPEFDIDVELPDYDNLKKPLVEVFTLDSATCAACAYMVGAVNVALDEFSSKINVVEYKFTEKENIARCKKMGVKNLPSVYINGQLKWSSIIPSREELFNVIDNLLDK